MSCNGCANNGIPSACIYSSVAAVAAVAVCAAVSSHSSVTQIPQRYKGGSLGLFTGLGSGAVMLYLRGRKHVVPCHWPCYAGFVPPCLLAWSVAAVDDQQKLSKSGFAASFLTAMMSGLSLVFYLSPEDGRQ
mmetsp:Transcript_28186/g.50881  ORF Transcript_28186/g.50881 Transcript_28186/m.50881 type:complete len:132 (+) Transcript_28186:44-439(+)